MAEAKEHSDMAAKHAKSKKPEEVYKDLERGNARFWMGCATRPEVDAFSRRSLIMQQFPSVVILGCSDSRVPIEIIFDQGLGDVFVIRVAGNTVDESTMASLEYAVEHLKGKVLMVLGHEGCGAVRGVRSLFLIHLVRGLTLSLNRYVQQWHRTRRFRNIRLHFARFLVR